MAAWRKALGRNSADKNNINKLAAKQDGGIKCYVQPHHLQIAKQHARAQHIKLDELRGDEDASVLAATFSSDSG
jgi:hypothetical protein